MSNKPEVSINSKKLGDKSRENSVEPLQTAGRGLADRIKIFGSKTKSGSSKESESINSIASGIDTNFLTFDPVVAKKLEIDHKKLNSLQKAVYENGASRIVLNVKKVAKLVSEKDRQIDKFDSEHNFTALFLCASMGTIEVAKCLLNGPKKANINIPCLLLNRTPLMQAVINEKEEMVAFLLANEADINLRDRWGCSAVFYTIFCKETTIMKLLLKSKPELEFNDKTGMCALHHSARLGKASHAVSLIQAGCSVEIRDEMERTPLHHAIQNDHLRVVEVLLKLDASISSKDIHSRSIIDYVNASPHNMEIFDAIETAKKNQKIDHEEVIAASRRYSQISNNGNNNSSVSPHHHKQASIVTVSSVGDDNDILSENPLNHRNTESSAVENNIAYNIAKLGNIPELANEESVCPIDSEEIKDDENDSEMKKDNASTNSEKYHEIIARYESEILILIYQIEEEQKNKHIQNAEYKKALEQLAILEKNLAEIKYLYEESIQQMNELQYEKDKLYEEVQILNMQLDENDGAQTDDIIFQLQRELNLKKEYIKDLEENVKMTEERLQKSIDPLVLRNDSLIPATVSTINNHELNNNLSGSSLEISTMQNNLKQVLEIKDERIQSLENLIRNKDSDIEILRSEYKKMDGLAEIISKLQESIIIKDELLSKQNRESQENISDMNLLAKLQASEEKVTQLQNALLEKESNISNSSNVPGIANENDTSYLENSIKKLEKVLQEKDSMIDTMTDQLKEYQSFEDNSIALRKVIREKDEKIEDLVAEAKKMREATELSRLSTSKSVDYLGFMGDIADEIDTLKEVVREKDIIIADLQNQVLEDNAVALRKIIREKEEEIEDLISEAKKTREATELSRLPTTKSVDYLGFMGDIEDEIVTLKEVVREKDLVIADLQKNLADKDLLAIKNNSLQSDIIKVTERVKNLKQIRQLDSAFESSPRGLNKAYDLNSSKILESIISNLGLTMNAMADLGTLKTDIIVNSVIVQDFQHSLADYIQYVRTDLSVINDNIIAYSKMKTIVEPSRSRSGSIAHYDTAQDDYVKVIEHAYKMKEIAVEKYERSILELKTDVKTSDVSLQIQSKKDELSKSSKMHDDLIKDQKMNLELLKLKSKLEESNEEVIATLKESHEKKVTGLKRYIEQKDAEISTLKEEIRSHHDEIHALKTEKVTIERELQAKLSLVASDSQVEKLELTTKISSLDRNIQKLQNEKSLLEINLTNALNDIETKSVEILKFNQYREQIESKFESALAEKERQVKMLKQEIEVLGQDKDAFMKSIKDLQEERMHLERKVNDISRQCESLQNSNASEIRSKDSQIQILTNNCIALEAEKGRLDTESVKLNTMINSLHNDLSTLKQKYHDLTSTSFAKDGQIAEFQHQIHSLKEFKHQVELLQGELTVASLSKEQLLELEQKHDKVKNQLEIANDKLTGLVEEHIGLENQYAKVSESVIIKTQRIRDLEEELTTAREQVILTAQLEDMLKHQHHEISQQLLKHGITLSTQQSSSLEMYIKVQQEAIGSLEEMLTNMHTHHQTQIDHYQSLQASANQKQQQSEIRIHGYEQEIAQLRNLLTEYKQKVMFLESKLEEAHRVHIYLKDEQSAILLQNQAQSQQMGVKYQHLKDESHKLQNKIIQLMKAKSDAEEELQRAYDGHVQKILKRVEAQSQNRETLEIAQKESHNALIETYESHIKTLTAELNTLRTNALKKTIQRGGR